MKKGKPLKIAKIGLEVLLGILVATFAIMFLMSKITASPVFVFNKTTMWVMTQSMDPTIPPKTYILVEKATAEDVEEGDIIVFRSTDPRIYGQFNTHRIVSKDGNTFVTKGDNNPGDDGIYSAKAENIVGKYVQSLPVLTFMGRVVMTPVGFAVLIILFLITMAFCIIPDVKESLKLKKQENEKEREEEKRRLIDEEIRRLKEEALNSHKEDKKDND